MTACSGIGNGTTTGHQRHLLGAVALLAATFATSAIAQSRNSELHTFHCLQSCPIGAAATNDTVVREIYTLSSNDLTKLAD